MGNDSLWRSFCTLVELEELTTDPRFVTNKDRVEHRDALRPILVERFRTRTVGHWIAALTAAGIPCGAVRDLDEVFSDPQVLERAMVVALNHPVAGAIRALGVPVKMNDTPGSVRTPPPTLGQHTEQVLTQDLGYERSAIEQLRKDGVI